MSFKKLTAFTLAEILLSLTVIGIVAAIALPSLLGNANERAWETQKKALYTRFSQSLPLLPSLNGYGTIEGTYSQGKSGQQGYVPQNVTIDTAAESFIRDGLSKVMKITNICAIPLGTENAEAAKILSDCGLPDKIITMNGSTTLELSNMISMSALNDCDVYSTDSNYSDFEQFDIKPAAFETVNGESILIYYNPNCEPNYDTDTGYYYQTKMCANFIYDLNGKKGPNTMGKDIGFITALYSTDPVVVAPNAYSNDISGVGFYTAGEKCREMDSNARVPNIDEVSAMFHNKALLNLPRHQFLSSTEYDKLRFWVHSWTGINLAPTKSTPTSLYLRCVKR